MHDVAVDFRPRATCAVCLVQEGGAFWAHIGDSRIYQVRDGAVLSRSRDHSHVEVLIQEGAITEEEAKDHPMRNFVECCIGGDAPVPDMSITGRKKLCNQATCCLPVPTACGPALATAIWPRSANPVKTTWSRISNTSA